MVIGELFGFRLIEKNNKTLFSWFNSVLVAFTFFDLYEDIVFVT